jgi:hypothetical protein
MTFAVYYIGLSIFSWNTECTPQIYDSNNPAPAQPVNRLNCSIVSPGKTFLLPITVLHNLSNNRPGASLFGPWSALGFVLFLFLPPALGLLILLTITYSFIYKVLPLILKRYVQPKK